MPSYRYRNRKVRRHVGPLMSCWPLSKHCARKLRAVLWQIPFGNTKMRAVNNTWNHYQDNKVEWFLEEPARTRLEDSPIPAARCATTRCPAAVT